MILSISFDVKWSNILIENYQFVRNYVKEKGTSKIFPRKYKCKKKEGETRIEEGMILWIRMMEKLCAGDAAGFNKETARLVRFES